MAAPSPALQRIQHPSTGHIDALDGLRGIAILMVLSIHLVIAGGVPLTTPARHRFAALLWTGWSGVDLFFALSGFLITGILLDTKQAANRRRSFYARRALRILPLYYLALGAAMFASYTFRDRPWLASSSPTLKGWLSYLLYYGNWWIPYKEQHHVWMGHFWSLCVEEQFYFIWPWFVWRLTQKSLVWACAIGMTVAFCIRLQLLHIVLNPASPIILMNTFAHMDSLLAGSFCAIAARNSVLLHRTSRAIPWVFSISLAGMVYIDVVLHDIWTRGIYTQSLGYTLLALGYSSALLWAVIKNESGHWIDRLLRWPVLRSFGKYSYGIYVYHAAIFAAGVVVVRHAEWYSRSLQYSFLFSASLIALSYGVAYLSFHYFESLFLKRKNHFRPTQSQNALSSR